MFRLQLTDEDAALLRLLTDHFSDLGCRVQPARVPLPQRWDMALDVFPPAEGLHLQGAGNEDLQDSLEQNIPGGVLKCRNGPNFNFIHVNGGFLRMFGYSQEELHQRFQNRFINMVYPGDRAELLRSVHRQLKCGDVVEQEYRVMCKSGETMWVLDKARLMHPGTEAECFVCILVDITHRRQQQEALRLSLERHKVIMDQATDIIFEWDIPEDTLIFSQNWRKKFGYDPIHCDISCKIPQSPNIHPADMSSFVQIMHEAAAGVPYTETEFRIKDCDGRYLWCRIRATAQYDAEGRPIKAIGVILDIDAEKKQKQALLDQAQRDALTGLYNKTTVNSMVEQRMKVCDQQGDQALLLIDVDHFKAVNDTYGHLSGDRVLSDVAAVLKKGVRSSDLVGRIGGDEFLVYFPEVAGISAARAKAEQLLKQLQAITPCQGAAAITCSIGTAVFPRGSIDYFALFKCADQALYYCKNNGRSGVAVYDPNLIEGQMPCGLAPTAVGAPIVSDESDAADERLAQYAFRTLYEADDVAAALERLLEIIGRAYDMSRAYIFERTGSGPRGVVTFEWCQGDVRPRMDAQPQQQGDLDQYQTHFDPSGIFFCPDVERMSPELRQVLAEQGIRSMLQCAIVDDGTWVGGVGFDECQRERDWTSGLIASFQLLANVLGTFLIQMRLKQTCKELQKHAMDRHQDSPNPLEP